MKLSLKSFTIFLSFTAIIACEKNITTTDKKENISVSKNEFLKSVNYSKEINLIQTDDRDGEWGGNTFIIRIYKDPESTGLLADYKELENKVETSSPPSNSNKFDNSNFGYGRKKVIIEKNNISLSDSEKVAIENSIIELIKSKINSKPIPSHSGYVNKIIFSDSTLIVEDYPSIKWSNFKKLQESLLEK